MAAICLYFSCAFTGLHRGIRHTNFLYCTLQTEYFQDDLFPEIIRTDKPVMTSQEWFRGDNKAPVKISLRPKDMKPCK